MTTVKEGLAHFSIDATKSLFTVQAFAVGIAAVVAHSPKFAIRDIVGSIAFIPDSLQNASIRATVSIGSLEVMDEVSRADRREIERVMFDEVLEQSHFQKTEYISSTVTASKISENMYRVKVMGDLTLHGITRGVALDPQVVVREDTIRAQGSFSIAQSDFGLKTASVAGGTLKLKDELRFAYFILARRSD